MTIPVALAGVSGISSVSGISRKRYKTSPSSSLTLDATSPSRGGGIERSEDVGEVVQSSTCVIPLNLKASFVQPLSLASARQLSWQESPWQRGFVFDET